MPDQSDMEFPDCMGDIETGGLDCARNPILSVSVVRFNIREGRVDPNIFTRNILPFSIVNRHWDESTRSWWLKDKREVLQQMMVHAEPAEKVLRELAIWAGGGKLSFWAMPTHFDHVWLQHAYRDVGLGMPFHYRSARDLNSWIDGLFFPHRAPTQEIWEAAGERDGSLHNALDDVFHQLKYLFAAVSMAKELRKVEAPWPNI